MKKIIIGLLIFLNLKDYSQSLGWSYENCLKTAKDTSRYFKYEEFTDTSKHLLHIHLFEKVHEKVLVTLYFKEHVNTCYQMVFTYDISFMNQLIQEYNDNYIKISDLKWRDKEKRFYAEISKCEQLFFLKVYL